MRIQEWVAFPSPGDLPNPGIEPASPALQIAEAPREAQTSDLQPNQASPSMGVSRQEYWSGLPLPSPKLQIRHR